MLDKQTFLAKFDVLLYLFEYIRRPKPEISPICVNYYSKLLIHLIQNRPYDFYLFFHAESKLLTELYATH